jgi:hypothetical protein
LCGWGGGGGAGGGGGGLAMLGASHMSLLGHASASDAASLYI